MVTQLINILGECRTLWGGREQAAQWFGNVAEFQQMFAHMCIFGDDFRRFWELSHRRSSS